MFSNSLYGTKSLLVMQLEVLHQKIKDAISGVVSQNKIGIAFSGGVDSTLIAVLCKQMNYDLTLLTIGFADSHDIN